MKERELDLQFEEPRVESQGPVTCLGMEFANDEERRAYFREELRKKLPELRKIDGFPIGEDEDIIALSDPPYYTACPNPWLNDFIAEWEKEKEQLVDEGKRELEKVVTAPYAADVSEGKNNPIYMAHAYHTKVPHPAIMRYILHYTEPGDIVFDGFAGTGMTGVAANLCGSSNDVNALGEASAKIGARHGICTDLSPIASLIAANYNLPFNPSSFSQKAEKILQKLEGEYGWMYDVKSKGSNGRITAVVWSDVYVCHNCGKEIVLWDSAVDEESQAIRDEFPCPSCGVACTKSSLEKVWESKYDPVLGEVARQNKKVPVKINYCVGNKRLSRKPTEEDILLLKTIDSTPISHPHTLKLPDGYNTAQPIRSNGITHIHQFYTRRAYILFSRLYELVKNDVHLLAWFTSSLQSTSKMNRFRFTGTGINAGTLYVPSLNWEFNPIATLRRKIETFVNSDYSNRGNSSIGVSSATSLIVLPSNSIDYMFIDPPFGANIMYSELSSIWEGWLRVSTNNKEEAIVNEVQHKDLFEYQRLMNASLKEFYRVLKPGKWLTMEFSNTSAAVWNSIQNALQGVGFVVVNVAALDKKQGSFKAVTSTTAVKQDLIITCYKPSDIIAISFEQSGSTQNIWTFIEDYLQHLPAHLAQDNKTITIVERTPKILYDRVITYYVQHGYPVPMDAQEFQAGLRSRYIERDGMFFTAQQAAEYEEKRKSTTDFVPMGILIGGEADGIAWLRRELENPQTYQELQPKWMQALAKQKKGDIQIEMRTLLEENFIEEPDGKWRLPDPEEEADREKLRIKGLMREFAAYAEMAAKPQGKIKQARLEALREGFKQCWQQKAYETIVNVGDKIPEEMLQEDEVLLRYYDIASRRM